MKKFIKQIALFCLLSFVFVEVVSTLMLLTNIYLINYPGKEIYHSILKSKQKSNTRILILGDSVASQLFPNSYSNDSINSLACNQAIGVIGQFLLLNNYLESGNKIDTLFLIYSPLSFQDNLNQIYTYHYFLKPFNHSEYSKYFTNTVYEQIDKIPYNKFSRLPHILITSWAPKFESEDKNDEYTFLSPISAEYLNKIKHLSIKFNFNLIIYPPPVSVNDKKFVENINQNEITMNQLDNEFGKYFNKIVYLEDSLFSDGVHLVNPVLHYANFKNKLFN